MVKQYTEARGTNSPNPGKGSFELRIVALGPKNRIVDVASIQYLPYSVGFVVICVRNGWVLFGIAHYSCFPHVANAGSRYQQVGRVAQW
ncbi:hypothetical protein FE257_003063 [Aspergillus nanangensis]|uniref:Uncharacterized protein n=1 Tax=Aspergillus nanangensis TaxID=2582783 RepID=A0AAD4GN15_ASPNN|nr:hypothetical protein FE257_003063 [Aspergillus nanangensis]